MLRDWKLVNKQEDAAVLGSWADELERSRLPPRLPWNDHQGALFDGVSDPVRVLNDDQVELDFLNSVPDVGSVVVRPVRPLPEGVRPDMATHELYDLNLVLWIKLGRPFNQKRRNQQKKSLLAMGKLPLQYLRPTRMNPLKILRTLKLQKRISLHPSLTIQNLNLTTSCE
jgi:hypothetical protein